MSRPLLRTVDLHRSYGGVRALQGADLSVEAGEIHALLGENGTGKSTLMRILAGVEQADSGVIEFDGEPVTFHTASHARAAGIGIVFQELSLFPDLDVLANLFAAREYRRAGRVDRRAMRRHAQPIMDRLGLTVAPDTPVGALTLAERQLVEIAKALVNRARLLILDEPNSALNAAESERLFQLVRELKADGVAMIYISHRLEEVLGLADRVSIMRGGRIVETADTRAVTVSSVVRAMLGGKETVADPGDRPRVTHGDAALRLHHLNVPRRLHGVSLDVLRGEVVGLVGLEGAGQQAVLRAVFGDLPLTGGRMELDGRPWAPLTPRHAARAGVAFVPADRTRAGLMMGRSVGDNIAQVRMATTAGWAYRHPDLHRRGQRRVAELGIRAATTHQQVRTLSGGNQQKVVLAKWLEVAPRLLLLDDPTRGVDVGGKAEIYELVSALARSGVGVLLTSTEFGEFRAVCHRVIVFHRGHVIAEIHADEATEHILAEAVNTGRVPAAVQSIHP